MSEAPMLLQWDKRAERRVRQQQHAWLLRNPHPGRKPDYRWGTSLPVLSALFSRFGKILVTFVLSPLSFFSKSLHLRPYPERLTLRRAL
jgi:hypothetical protein